MSRRRDLRGRTSFPFLLAFLLIHFLLVIATPPSAHDNLAALANARRHSSKLDHSRRGGARRAPPLQEKERALADFGGDGWMPVKRSTVPKGRTGFAGSGMLGDSKRNVKRATFNTVAQISQAESAPVAASKAKETRRTQAAAGAFATKALAGNPLLPGGGSNGGGSPFFGDPFFGTGEPFLSSVTSTSTTTSASSSTTTEKARGTTTLESSTSSAAAAKVTTTTSKSEATTTSTSSSSTVTAAIQGNESGGIGLTVETVSQIATSAITVEPSATASATSAATSSATSSSANATTSVSESSAPTGGPSSTSGVSAAADQTTSSVISAAAQSAPPSAFVLPGKSLAILPIGLGVFAGVTVLALIVVGVVTFERRKYRAQFRQRRMAEQVTNAAGFTDGAGAYGGTDNGGRMTEGRI